MFTKTLVLIIISSLLSFSAAIPLHVVKDDTGNTESTPLNSTSPSLLDNVKRGSPTKLVLNLVGCTLETLQSVLHNPGKLTAKFDGLLYGSIIPKGGLYLAVDPKDAESIGKTYKCPGGKYVIVEYNFDGTGLRIVDMTAGEKYDETAHAVIGYFDGSRIGYPGHQIKMYVLQNPIAVAEPHLEIKLIQHMN